MNSKTLHKISGHTSVTLKWFSGHNLGHTLCCASRDHGRIGQTIQPVNVLVSTMMGWHANETPGQNFCKNAQKDRPHSGCTTLIFWSRPALANTSFRPNFGHKKSIFRSHFGHTKTIFRSHSGHTKTIFRSHFGHIKPLRIPVPKSEGPVGTSCPQGRKRKMCKVWKGPVLIPAHAWATKKNARDKSSCPVQLLFNKTTRNIITSKIERHRFNERFLILKMHSLSL